jgi:hypothetical protein
MSDAPAPATIAPAPAAMTPAPGGLPANPGNATTIRTSAVSADASASRVNQQAAAAGDALGGSAGDAPVDGTTDPLAPATAAPVQSETGPATLETAPPGFLHIESGNKIVDQVSQLLANQNFAGAQDIITEIMDTQELTLTSKAELVKGLGADVANLVISQLESSVATVKEAGAKEGARLKEIAMHRFGGNDPDAVWKGIQDFAKSPESGLTQGERNTMNELLNAGGYKAEMTISHLADKYEKSSSYARVPELMEGTAIGTVGFQPLSKAEYQQQIGPAIGEHGEASTVVQALRNRRAVSISRGH